MTKLSVVNRKILWFVTHPTGRLKIRKCNDRKEAINMSKHGKNTRHLVRYENYDINVICWVSPNFCKVTNICEAHE